MRRASGLGLVVCVIGAAVNPPVFVCLGALFVALSFYFTPGEVPTDGDDR